jgi:Tol biopolymer transport system component
MRIAADGEGDPELIKSGRIEQGRRTYAFWLRGPVMSPDGATIAVTSDAPDPAESPVVLQFLDPDTGEMTAADAAADAILGHQDAEWRPDGLFVAYTRNARDGSRGASIIMRHGVESGRTARITGPGYLQPSYSRDGRWLAATRTTTLGNDVVILNGRTGEELLRVTADGASFNPVWSPAGDAIAYLHLSGQTVDLRLARLGDEPGAWTVEETISLTEVSGLDPESGPDWFIPEGDLPPLPTPVPASATPSGGDTEPSPS